MPLLREEKVGPLTASLVERFEEERIVLSRSCGGSVVVDPRHVGELIDALRRIKRSLSPPKPRRVRP